ncbi:MAG: hypothetical protein HYS26_01960 [Candidatus Kaiserbacteria bacterium]|nr:MAG: hypothetical protein HYS26_01960 [Candidatus Kaiserbacteria bacterium]
MDTQSNIGKYIIWLLVAVIAAVGGYYAWQLLGQAASQAPQNEEPLEVVPQFSTYATSTFSITYPQGYTVDDAYAYEGVPKKPIAGVKFTIPGAMATGTNLSTDSGVSVEWLPRAQKCAGDIFLFDNVRSQELTVGSTTWSVATTSGAGAGNLYEEMVYAVVGSKPCTAVRYLLHSTNIGNYDPGAVREFDRLKLIADFNAIRDSLTLSQ